MIAAALSNHNDSGIGAPGHTTTAVHTQPGELPAPRFYSGAARLV